MIESAVELVQKLLSQCEIPSLRFSFSFSRRSRSKSWFFFDSQGWGKKFRSFWSPERIEFFLWGMSWWSTFEFVKTDKPVRLLYICYFILIDILLFILWTSLLPVNSKLANSKIDQLIPDFFFQMRKKAINEGRLVNGQAERIVALVNEGQPRQKFWRRWKSSCPECRCCTWASKLVTFGNLRRHEWAIKRQWPKTHNTSQCLRSLARTKIPV